MNNKLTNMKSILGKVGHRLRDPVGVAYNAYEDLCDGYVFPAASRASLKVRQDSPDIINVGNFNTYNGGDAVLSVVLRDLIDLEGGPCRWRKIHAHKKVDYKTIDRINSSNGVVIGGGGLFLADNNVNTSSGWQWGISNEQLAKINAPINVFAVGYNRFRGQPEFPSVFVDSLNVLVDKSSFFGLRNQGSIRAVREYLSPELRDKVRYQPCMTTIIKSLYGIESSSIVRPVISVNMAFDRLGLRFGQNYHLKLNLFSQALKRLSADYEIECVSHSIPDEGFYKYLKSNNVPFTPVKLYRCSAEKVISYYKSVALTLGMRGHGQMIPFGIGNCIISIVTHDKMKWFLDDNELNEYGLEFSQDNFAEILEAKSRFIMANLNLVQGKLNDRQEKLAVVCRENAKLVYSSFR